MKYLRFSDLVERGIVNNRVTLARWIAGNGFPPPVRLGANTVAWPEAAIEGWLAARAANSSVAGKTKPR